MKIYIGPYPDGEEEQVVDVEIHEYDTWSMDHTLAYIVLPMLKQLKETKHGAPNVDSEDVPQELWATPVEETEYNKDGSTDANFFKRWDWILDEMIFAFEQKNSDWEQQFWGEWIEDETKLLGGYHDKMDLDGMKVYQDRISNGFRLFGKYYESLWD